jgi:hypothetical protein
MVISLGSRIAARPWGGAQRAGKIAADPPPRNPPWPRLDSIAALLYEARLN